MSSPERRTRSRIQAGFSATIMSGELSIPIKTKNISLKGMLATSDEASTLAPGTECKVVLRLSDDVQILIEARVVRNGANEVAVDFMSMEPESFFHLKRLVRFYADDPDEIDREIAVSAFKD